MTVVIIAPKSTSVNRSKPILYLSVSFWSLSQYSIVDQTAQGWMNNIIGIAKIPHGFLTPRNAESLERLIFLRQIEFYVLRTIVLYGIIPMVIPLDKEVRHETEVQQDI